MIKNHEIKNVTDFNVADSVRRDIKVLVTKTRYTVYIYIYIYIYVKIAVKVLFCCGNCIVKAKETS